MACIRLFGALCLDSFIGDWHCMHDSLGVSVTNSIVWCIRLRF